MVLVIVVAMNHEPKDVNVAQLKTECGVMISLGGWPLCPARAASTCAITHGWERGGPQSLLKQQRGRKSQ